MPEDLNKKIQIAVKILKNYGAKKIYLFGSVVNGDYNEYSDIDIAVQGLPNNVYYKAGGEVMMAINKNVDLIDLDEDNPFIRYLQKNGELKYVG